MAAPMTGDKDDRLAAERAETELVRGLAERAFDPPPLDLVEPVDLVEPAAADDAVDGAGLWPPQWTVAQILRFAA